MAMRYLAFVLITLLHFSALSVAHAQDSKKQIQELREASNAALKALDHEKVLSFLTEDALTTTGNGTVLNSKQALRGYIKASGPSKMYWVRTPGEIKVNESRKLAWETGVWKGYDPEKGAEPIIGGKYSAMWTKASGEWKIKSQLFVTLE